MRISDWSSDVCSSDLDHIGGHGEADALAAAAAREDGRVDPGELSVHAQQRTAGVARVDGCVGLDEEVEVRDPDIRAGERRYDAAGDGLADAERVANGKPEVAHLELVAVAQRNNRQLFLRSEEHTSELQSLLRISYA